MYEELQEPEIESQEPEIESCASCGRDFIVIIPRSPNCPPFCPECRSPYLDEDE